VVGAYYGDFNNDTDPRAFILQWNGTKWALSNSPNPGSGNALTGVTCASASDCWTVGTFYDPSAVQTLIERWDGTAWSIFASENPGGSARRNSLNAVTCTSGPECWAVGVSSDGARSVTLIERYVNAAPLPAELQITSITRLANGHILLQGIGLANNAYRLEASPDLSAGSFEFLAAVNSDSSGLIGFEDADAANFDRRFYRLAP